VSIDWVGASFAGGKRLLECGAINNGLVNGVQIEVRLGGLVIDSLEGFRVRHNYEWNTIARSELMQFSGAGEALNMRTDFSPDFGTPLELSPGDYLGMRIRDNLSSLLAQPACVRGSLDFA